MRNCCNAAWSQRGGDLVQISLMLQKQVFRNFTVFRGFEPFNQILFFFLNEILQEINISHKYILSPTDLHPVSVGMLCYPTWVFQILIFSFSFILTFCRRFTIFECAGMFHKQQTVGMCLSTFGTIIRFNWQCAGA